MARDTSFSYSFVVLPAEQRRGIGAVWDFCRAVDDAVDEAVDAATAALAVTTWRAEVGRLFGSEPAFERLALQLLRRTRCGLEQQARASALEKSGGSLGASVSG